MAGHTSVVSVAINNHTFKVLWLLISRDFVIRHLIAMEQSNAAEVHEVAGELTAHENLKPSPHHLYTICFHDITYEVKQRKYCRRISDKVILNSVR